MRVALLFLSSFIFSSDLPELLSKNHKFSADITIFDSESRLSSGYISYLNGDFTYSIDYPSKQILAGLDGFLYIQDDDFKQVLIYKDDESFLIKQLLLNSYDYDELSCSSKCYKLIINDGRISNAIIIFKNNLLYEMHVQNFQNKKFLIKFENFVLESTNITYIAPEGYEIITDD